MLLLMDRRISPISGLILCCMQYLLASNLPLLPCAMAHSGFSLAIPVTAAVYLLIVYLLLALLQRLGVPKGNRE